MIQLMVRLGKWLESRFPEKVIVTAESYSQLHTEIGMLRSELKDAQLSLNKTLERLSVAEGHLTNVVHKEPVKVLIDELAKLKADHTSFKASMGFRQRPIANSEIQAMLNGLPIGDINE